LAEFLSDRDASEATFNCVSLTILIFTDRATTFSVECYVDPEANVGRRLCQSLMPRLIKGDLMRVVSKRLIIAAFLLVATGIVSQAQAQSRPITGDEYLRSVSVQAKERSRQGPTAAGVQTVVDIAALPPLRQTATTVTAGFTPSNANSIPNAASTLSPVHTARFQTATPSAANSSTNYPYPAQTPPRIAPAIQANSGFGGSGTFVNSPALFNGTAPLNSNPLSGTNAAYETRASYGTNATTVVAPTNSAATSSYSVPHSIPTGYANPIAAPSSYTAPKYGPTVYPQTNYPSTVYAPTSVSSSNVSGLGQNVYRTPTVGFAPANSANTGIANQNPTPGGYPVGTNFLSPTQVAPQPIYPPAAQATTPVQLQNLPPGTYQGTGLDGRSATFVDGQPVRNLFRYIFP
jgi:hypothetical protein